MVRMQKKKDLRALGVHPKSCLLPPQDEVRKPTRGFTVGKKTSASQWTYKLGRLSLDLLGGWHSIILHAAHVDWILRSLLGMFLANFQTTSAQLPHLLSLIFSWNVKGVQKQKNHTVLKPCSQLQHLTSTSTFTPEV